jgi:hypothetical protein
MSKAALGSPQTSLGWLWALLDMRWFFRLKLLLAFHELGWIFVGWSSVVWWRDGHGLVMG